MKLSNKLLVICVTLIVIPSLLLTGAWLVVRQLQTRQIRRQYELTEKVDPYSFSAAQRFDAMLRSMGNDIDQDRENDPDCVLQTDYLVSLNKRMNQMGGYVLAWQDGEYYYSGGDASEGMQAASTKISVVSGT